MIRQLDIFVPQGKKIARKLLAFYILTDFKDWIFLSVMNFSKGAEEFKEYTKEPNILKAYILQINVWTCEKGSWKIVNVIYLLSENGKYSPKIELHRQLFISLQVRWIIFPRLVMRDFGIIILKYWCTI